MSEDAFHLGVKAIIRNPSGQVLLLKVNPAALKNGKTPYWDIPGGRIQRGSTPEETLRRELEEETGLTRVESIKPFAWALSNIRIPLEGTDVGLILAAYLCDVAGELEVKLSEEHTEAAWFEPAEAAGLLEIKYPADFTAKLKELGS